MAGRKILLTGRNGVVEGVWRMPARVLGLDGGVFIPIRTPSMVFTPLVISYHLLAFH